ncbi:MAG TPA: PIN domain-containing protein [Candidatus Acidoferrales bacterium]|jgi:predicted nucleic acid-binding protein|nr:PIN domain-containing protein [Candidatus Acidoferrales bacterium]
MLVIIDTSVFVSAIGSRTGHSWGCFVLMARRRFRPAVTKEILAEYEDTAERLSRRPGKFHGLRWRPLFDWVCHRALFVEAAPLGKPRSRDAGDDVFLDCALASGAKIIVSHDADLLALEKPFGIDIMKPAIFVARFK